MKKHALWPALSRWIVALVFIFSGFVKGVDPWGTAIKLGEYLRAFSMDWLVGAQFALSILLSVTEMTIGLCLLFRVRERGAARLALLFMGFFTVLTLVLALWNPVADCGCFGDAVKLTNWQTFYKNILLSAFALLLWRGVHHERHGHDRQRSIVENSMVFFFLLFSSGVGIYSMRHLPLVDFLPFKVGANIPAQLASAGGDVTTTLVYRDRLSGELREFALQDTSWYDTLRWEYVDTRIEERMPSRRPAIADFSVFDSDGDHATALLASPREVFLIVMTRTEEGLRDGCRERMEEVVRYAARHGYPAVCVTTSPLPEGGLIALGERGVPVYNIDPTTLNTMIRARTGLVLLKEGIVLGKWNCRDIPRFDSLYGDRTVLEAVVERSAESGRAWLLGTLLVALALAYVVFTAHRRKR